MSGNKKAGGFAEHYEEVSSSYDKYFSFFAKSKFSIITRLASFSSTDTVLDIGGGTGEISHQLWKKFNFKQPVVCVDPSESLLEVAKQKEGLKIVQGNAEEYVSHLWDGTQFSRVIMIGCVHHLKDPGLVLEGIGKMLTDDGVCFIMLQTAESATPFIFKSALTDDKRYDFDELARLAESKGLKAKVTYDHEPFEVDKQFIAEFNKRRMYTVIAVCTDQEIEEGIKELMIRYKDCEMVRVDYGMKMVIITK